VSAPQRLAIADGVRRMRADKALASAFPERSRVAVQRAFDAGLVALRGLPIKRSATVRAGDVLEFTFPEVKAAELRAVDIRLDVLFEDEFLLVVDKPAGMVVHPGAGTREDTLVHALLAHCAGSLSGIGGVARPGIVHRLDRGTSGLLVVARTPGAYRSLVNQLGARTVSRRYRALVIGAVESEVGVVDAPVGRSLSSPTRMSVSRKGKEARTRYRVERRFGQPVPSTLLEASLETGRTHQIRVHLAAIGHPVVGDEVYGRGRWLPGSTLDRPFLHAFSLAFDHPGTGERVEWTSPLPPDLAGELARLSG